jgi:hypothetical protein
MPWYLWVIAGLSILLLVTLEGFYERARATIGEPVNHAGTDEVTAVIGFLKQHRLRVEEYDLDYAQILQKYASQFALGWPRVGYQPVLTRDVVATLVTAGVVRQERHEPVPPTPSGAYPLGATPYEMYHLTDLGQRVVRRLAGH